MTPFTQSYRCRSGAHCKTCRADAAWRAKVGAPEVCDHPHEPEIAQPNPLDTQAHRAACWACIASSEVSCPNIVACCGGTLTVQIRQECREGKWAKT